MIIFRLTGFESINKRLDTVEQRLQDFNRYLDELARRQANLTIQMKTKEMQIQVELEELDLTRMHTLTDMEELTRKLEDEQFAGKLVSTCNDDPYSGIRICCFILFYQNCLFCVYSAFPF